MWLCSIFVTYISLSFQRYSFFISFPISTISTWLKNLVHDMLNNSILAYRHASATSWHISSGTVSQLLVTIVMICLWLGDSLVLVKSLLEFGDRWSRLVSLLGEMCFLTRVTPPPAWLCCIWAYLCRNSLLGCLCLSSNSCNLGHPQSTFTGEWPE